MIRKAERKHRSIYLYLLLPLPVIINSNPEFYQITRYYILYLEFILSLLIPKTGSVSSA